MATLYLLNLAQGLLERASQTTDLCSQSLRKSLINNEIRALLDLSQMIEQPIKLNWFSSSPALESYNV
jgi:hypothetical protein